MTRRGLKVQTLAKTPTVLRVEMGGEVPVGGDVATLVGHFDASGKPAS